MRRRLRKFLPIVLLALVVQIIAPIAACWAASIAATDPLHAAAICHDSAAASDQTDQTGQPRAHDGCCSVCSVAQTSALLDAPQTSAATPYLQSSRVVWPDRAPDPFGSRTGSHAQARAPPQLT
jgi:Protein of unknown function (DUF2946)